MKKLAPIDEKALLASYVGGEGPTELAKRFGISRQWASKIVNDFKKQRAGIEDIDGVNYKARLRRKAIIAVESGLEAQDDPYKRARVGVNVLEGIGEFVTGQKLQVGGDVSLTVSWMPVQTAAQCIDVTASVTPQIGEKTIRET